MTTLMDGFDIPVDEALIDLNDDDFSHFLEDIIDDGSFSPNVASGGMMGMMSSQDIMMPAPPVAIATHALGDEHINVTAAPIVPVNVNVPAAKYAVDYLDPATIPATVHPAMVRSENTLAGLEYTTVFGKKYFRFDNKMLQCFPRCEKFQDVREARMLGLDHGYNDVRRTGGAWCSGAVSATLTVAPQTNPGLLHARGRFVMATPEASVMPGDYPQFLTVGQHVRDIPASPHIMTGSVVVLTYRGAPVTDASGKVALAVHFQPGQGGWTHDMELPRHRRNVSQQGTRVTIPLFLFETTVYMQVANGFTVLARATSSLFEISSVRTLLREALLFRQSVAATKGIGGAAPSTAGFGSSPLPPQKKSKVTSRKFQRVSAKELSVQNVTPASSPTSVSSVGSGTATPTEQPTTTTTTAPRRASLLERFLRLSMR